MWPQMLILLPWQHFLQYISAVAALALIAAKASSDSEPGVSVRRKGGDGKHQGGLSGLSLSQVTASHCIFSLAAVLARRGHTLDPCGEPCHGQAVHPSCVLPA